MCSQKRTFLDLGLGRDSSLSAQAVFWEDGTWEEIVLIFTASKPLLLINDREISCQETQHSWLPWESIAVIK